jgi:hypothetical protein
MRAYLVYGVNDYGQTTELQGGIKVEDDLTEIQVIKRFLFTTKPGVFEVEEDILETGFYKAKPIGIDELEKEVTALQVEIDFYRGLM